MKIPAYVLLISLGGLSQESSACSFAKYYPVKTPRSAFQSAAVVIHARVLSREQEHLTFKMKVDVLRTLKGTFSGETIFARIPEICGPTKLEVGRDYVFFFHESGKWYFGGTPYGRGPWGAELEAENIMIEIRYELTPEEKK